jgi:ribosome-associated protein
LRREKVERELEADVLLSKLAQAVTDKKAAEVVALDMSQLVYYTDYFLVCSGRSDQHVRAIKNFAQEKLQELGVGPLSVEGADHGRWILMDYGTVMVHIFLEVLRDFYELEKLWTDATPVQLQLDEPPAEEYDSNDDDDDDDDLFGV